MWIVVMDGDGGQLFRKLLRIKSFSKDFARIFVKQQAIICRKEEETVVKMWYNCKIEIQDEYLGI